MHLLPYSVVVFHVVYPAIICFLEPRMRCLNLLPLLKGVGTSYWLWILLWSIKVSAKRNCQVAPKPLQSNESCIWLTFCSQVWKSYNYQPITIQQFFDICSGPWTQRQLWHRAGKCIAFDTGYSSVVAFYTTECFRFIRQMLYVCTLLASVSLQRN